MNTEQDQPETLAAILAEMRDPCAPRAPSLPALADRIEAAAAMERNAHTNDIHDALYKATGIPGNAAAMREALENAIARAEEARNYLLRSADTKACMEELIDAARAALAAPARNCDIYRTLEDADYAYANRETTGLRFSSYTDFEAWLFAPAEGGDHA